MFLVILAIHIFLGVSMIGVILLQRSEAGGLAGMGGGNAFMTARGTANLLTRVTAVLASGFMATSICLAILADRQIKDPTLINQAVQAATLLVPPDLDPVESIPGQTQPPQPAPASAG